MKICSDFVSNSSSSSFVIACSNKNIDSAFNAIVESCSDAKSEWHNKNLVKRNRSILDFCFNTYQLLFLGDLLVETKLEKYNLSRFKDIYSNSSCAGKDKVAEEEWERYKSNMKIMKSGAQLDRWFIDEFGDDEYDEDKDESVHHKKTYAYGIVVPNAVMSHDFYRYEHINNDEETKRFRVDAILELAHQYADDGSKKQDFTVPIDIYQITKATIENTKDLIEAGYSVNLDEWENLDKLEKKISNGESIFRVRIASLGDGYGDFYLFSEKDDALDVYSISGIEFVSGESL